MKCSLAFACAIAATSALAGQQSAPVRDAGLVPTFGTGAVTGVVVDDETPARPVRRAIVSLSGPELRPSRSAITADDGTFSVVGLPDGQVTVTVSRASFVTSMYGAKRPGRTGTPIRVEQGKTMGPLTIRIWRGAVIAGTLRDEVGRPAAGVTVTATPAKSIPPSVLTLSATSVRTTETGEFRLFGLEPGPYVVSARPGAGSGPTETKSESEVDALLEALMRRSAAPTPPAPAPVQTRAATSTFAPIYYPGTPSLSQALPLTLVAGQEQAGVDFQLARVPTALVEGRITTLDGQPAAGASIQFTAVSESPAFASGPAVSLSATSGPDGRFRIFQVTPGTYRLLARVLLPGGPASDPRVNVSVRPTGRPTLWATTNVVVTGTDINDLALVAEPGVSITGRFRLAPDTTNPPADLSGFRAYLALPALVAARGPVPVTDLAFTPAVTAEPDGAFDISNVAPGTYYFQALSPAGATVAPRTALSRDRDVLGELIEIGKNLSLGPISVVLSGQHSEVSGRAESVSGQASADVFVVAFAEDRKLWTNLVRVQAVRPDVDGRFSIKDLPPGTYRLAAVEDIDPDDWKDPSLLERLLPHSTRIEIKEGGKVIQNLRVGG